MCLRACKLSCFSGVWLFATPRTVACQAPLSMGFSRQEHWSGMPCPPPGDLPNPEIEPTSPTSPALADRFFTISVTWEVPNWILKGFKYKQPACNSGDPSSIPGSGRSAEEGIGYPLQYSGASLVAQLVKNPPAMWETWVWSLGWEDLLEKGKATHASILAWRIPGTV